jgi:hypothetical protein
MSTIKKIQYVFLLVVVLFLMFTSIRIPVVLVSRSTPTGQRSIHSASILPNSHSSLQRYTLRLDWTNVPVISPLAKFIDKRQSGKCKNGEKGNLRFKENFMRNQGHGLGSAIHFWSHDLCHALENDMIMVTRGSWLWSSPELCDNPYEKSPLQCYFGPHEAGPPSCFSDIYNQTSFDAKGPVSYDVKESCGFNLTTDFRYDVSDFRAAAMEWLFQSVKPNVIREARRQIYTAFGLAGLPDPSNMITVNIRWGDKFKEMKLQPVSRYIEAVEELLNQRNNISDSRNDTVHIYLTTEDTTAIHEFLEAAPDSWIVHTSGPNISPNNTDMMSIANGRSGIESLGALLVAMESNGYVLTTGSNWSRLINELRKNVLDPRCNNCTRMIDILPGEW